jgi:hypothetical protein
MEPNAKRSLKEELLRPRYCSSSGLITNAFLLEHGLAEQLCDSLHSLEQSITAACENSCLATAAAVTMLVAVPDLYGELNIIRAIRNKWLSQLHATLTQHCDETGKLLMRTSQEESRQRPSSACRWLFTTNDILVLLEAVKHPNLAHACNSRQSWCMCPLELSSIPLLQLRGMFSELAPSMRQCGLDDELHGWFADARYSIGENLLAKAYSPFLVAFARRGIPTGLRRRVWLTAMHLEDLSEQSYHYFEALKSEVRRVTLVTDDMVCNDVSSPSNEHDFFVFGDMVKEVYYIVCPKIIECVHDRFASFHRCSSPFVGIRLLHSFHCNRSRSHSFPARVRVAMLLFLQARFLQDGASLTTCSRCASFTRNQQKCTTFSVRCGFVIGASCKASLLHVVPYYHCFDCSKICYRCGLCFHFGLPSRA